METAARTTPRASERALVLYTDVPNRGPADVTRPADRVLDRRSNELHVADRKGNTQ